MQVTQCDSSLLSIPPCSFVTYKQTGNISSAVYCSSRSSGGCKIVNIDKDNYIVLSTGEVRSYNRQKSRQGNLANVRRSLARLRDYINTNVLDTLTAKWITLTYAENMQDTKKLYLDFEKFIKRFRYEYGNFEYIVAMEPQGRGAWHAHLLCIFPNIAPYIPNKHLAKIWGNGFVKVQKLYNITNVGAYLTAYLGDMELTATNPTALPVTLKKNKRSVKGGRLHFYPCGFNLYRCSRGKKRPTISRVTEHELVQITQNAQLTYEKTIFLEDKATNFSCFVHYRYFYTPPTNLQNKELNHHEKLHFRHLA